MSTSPSKAAPEGGGNGAAQSQARLELAVKRIEKALKRISDAADTIRPAPASVSELVVQHESLREIASEALGQIDMMIAEMETEAPKGDEARAHGKGAPSGASRDANGEGARV